MTMEQISVQLDDALAAALRESAADNERSIAAEVRYILRGWLNPTPPGDPQ